MDNYARWLAKDRLRARMKNPTAHTYSTMFFSIGTPESLSSIGQAAIDIAEAKSKVEIAVLDDEKFQPREALLSHKFRIVELGADIRSLDQVSTYSIIICDVNGVGKAFGSNLEGAHLVAEIRKMYPDKFLMAYTGKTYSLSIANALTSADKRVEKDASVDVWVQNLEVALNEIVNLRQRWIRMRRALLERGVELFDVFRLEQALIKSVKNGESKFFDDQAQSLNVSSETKELVLRFSATALASLIGNALGI